MVPRWLFALTLLYFVKEWCVSRVARPSVPVERQSEGAREGVVVHRYHPVTQTLSGKPTDVTFHYVEAGDRWRECVVFLHGFMDTWRLWRQQLASFAADYHLLAFDLKGTGQSSMPYPHGLFPEMHEPGGDYTLTMQAEEIVTALEQLGVRRFTLVTLDLGTIIGDILAGHYTERIQRYLRCQQPLVGHFRASIPQGRLLRSPRGARCLTAMLEAAPGALLRVLYGRTGWPALDRTMKRTKHPMPEALLAEAVREASYAFQHGPRTGRPGAFVCAWAGLYQHNRDYMRYLLDNLHAYRRYTFPVHLVQGVHDIAMPPTRFDGSTGMAFKTVHPARWGRVSAASTVVLSRPFFTDGRGIGDGYVPWVGLLPDCTRPLHTREFFPHASSVELTFVDAGHFVPLEAPETFNELLRAFLGLSSGPAVSF